MRQLVFSLLFIVLMGASLWPANYQMITDYGTSAEMIAIGGVQGFSDSSTLVFENPAALYKIDSFSVSVFSSTVFTEVTYQNLSMAFPLGRGHMGIGYMSSGVEGIPDTIEQNGVVQQNGSFSYKNWVGKIAYQYPVLKGVYGSIGVNYYSNEIHTVTGTGYGFDLGLMTKVFGLDLSLHVNNLVPTKGYKGQVTYKDSADASYEGEETLPIQGAVALAFDLWDFRLLGQYKNDGDHNLVSAGLKYTPSFLKLLSLSGGYKEFSALSEVNNSVTMGASLNLGSLSLHYAYEKSTHIDYDSINYFSIGFSL